MRRVWSVLAISLLGVFFSATASAQSPGLSSMTEEPMDDAKARAHFRVGLSLYQAGRFAEAAKEFEVAYQLSNRPELLYNLYVAYRDASDLPKAVQSLRGYLDKVPSSPDRVNLKARLAAMEEALKRENEKAAQSARPEEAAPSSETAAPSNPPSAVATAAAPSSSRQEPKRSTNIWPWVVTGVGAAMVAAGTVTGILALGKVSDLEDQCPGNRCPSAAQSTRDQAQTLVTTTDILLIGGGVVAASGIVWWVLSSRSHSDSAPKERAAPALACSSRGCTGSLTVHF